MLAGAGSELLRTRKLTASFAARSPRSLPWEDAHRGRRERPTPQDYPSAQQQYSSAASSRPRSASGTYGGAVSSFSSSSPRFCGSLPARQSPIEHVCGLESESRRPRPASASAAFASRSARFVEKRTISPGPGAHSPHGQTLAEAAASPTRCAALRSTSERRLPFEAGPDRREVRGLDPGAYSPALSASARPKQGSRGVAAMHSSSPRFKATRATTPGPGAYAHHHKTAAASGGPALPASTADYSLTFERSSTPGVGSYEPHAPTKPTIARSASFSGRSSFGSTSARFSPSGTCGPGPGAYGGVEAFLASSSGVGLSKCLSMARSSTRNLSGSQARFPCGGSASPGPDAYGDDSGTPLRALSASAAFASATPRTQLPFETAPRASPGPGAYEPLLLRHGESAGAACSHGVGSAYASGRTGLSGSRSHGQLASTPFRFSSPRFPKARSETPSPAAYSPQHTQTSRRRSKGGGC